MKNSTYAVLFSLIFFSIACKQEKDPGPDLTTQLVGRYEAQYQIVTPGGTLLEGGPSQASTVEIRRKNNNTINVLIAINDGIVQENNRYDAKVSLRDSENDYSSKKGRISSFKVTTENANSSLNVYDNGDVNGGFVYGNAKGQTVSISWF
ncbi:hypothetical protein [Salmonirosea aquatica]|uniref:Uncharacterized protein n=1 Tax=Salmonirosea aquatica TaxID=2654236 RepID=A0A7C9BPI8_9BACT|nr:hypothetical protein [Cytophagaceae bacterium SJW1-29]